MNNARVTVIPATRSRYASNAPEQASKKRRVAAYARVSTDGEEQLSSYEAQVDHYTRHIQENDEWDFAGIYTDEGISATNTKKREGFNRMVADALAGKIDLIITKSVSRFTRNTVDSLTTVRQLKEKGVEVFFEKENIYTLDSKGELLITIMSSLAQEESRSISENVSWGLRKAFADGKFSMAYGLFLGYERGPDGLPQIVEKQAEVVRMIYRLFLEGKTYNAIARHLMALGIPTPGGKQRWTPSVIASILQNEKYRGDARLQKSFTVDFLSKQKKINEGEVPQYYVENSHPAIIQPEVFELVQAEIARRKEHGLRRSGLNCFSSRIVCGECGSFYGSKTWHSKSKYKRVIWRCNDKYHNAERCQTPHVYESEIQVAFVTAFNRIISNKEGLLSDCEELIMKLTDSSANDRKRTKLEAECAALAEAMQQGIQANAHAALDQAEYQKRYDELAAQYADARQCLEKAEGEGRDRSARRSKIAVFLEELRQRDGLIDDFDEALWNATLDSVTVQSSGDLLFAFKDGSAVTIEARA